MREQYTFLSNLIEKPEYNAESAFVYKTAAANLLYPHTNFFKDILHDYDF